MTDQFFAQAVEHSIWPSLLDTHTHLLILRLIVAQNTSKAPPVRFLERAARHLRTTADSKSTGQPSVYHKVEGDSVPKRSSGAWGVKGGVGLQHRPRQPLTVAR